MFVDFKSKILNHKSHEGFTLIELIVYLALFGIIIGGGVATAFAVFEGSGRAQTRGLLQNEGDFLLGKIEWALSGVQVINQPSDETPYGVLQVTKYGGSSFTLNLNGGNLEFQRDAALALPLNNSGITVSGLKFTRDITSGSGVNPESVRAEFTLTAKTPSGAMISQDFSTTKYLRR